jgi:hypothetical protein
MFCGKIAVSAMVVGVSVMLLGGCSSDRTKMNEINKKIERQEAWRGQEMPVMTEVTYKGKMYVMGSKASATALETKGTMPKMSTKAFGFGPGGETVIFEDNKLGMADLLIEDYKAKYKIK